MATQGRLSKKICFSDFELDLETAELWNGETKIVLPGKPFQVLKILLERPGELVGRRELIERLWPDGTFVDFDQSLNKAVNRLRDALNDLADSPALIETLPRKGYRFIGTLSSSSPNPIPRPPSQILAWPDTEFPSQLPRHSAPLTPPLRDAVPSRDASPASARRQIRIPWTQSLLAFSTVALLLTGIFYYRNTRPHTDGSKQTVMLEASPFAAVPGQKAFPSFSPDGSRIAFALDRDGRGFDLYVKAVGSESLLRLTQHPSKAISSAWSPDGTQIAFHRIDGPETGIYLVPALGGPERQVHATRIVPDLGRLLPISWSPDGRWIAFADIPEGNIHSRIWLLPTSTWLVEPIRRAPGCERENSPSFSHDGRFLAFACFTGTSDSALYIWQITGGELKEVGSLQGYVYGLAWSGDDHELIYTRFDSGPGLGATSIGTGTVRRLGFTGAALFPSVSARDQLAFITSTSRSELWRADLRHPESHPALLVPSTSWEQDADISPNGRQLAFQAGRSGTPAIWISDIDGSNLVQISNADVPSGSPQWSPDGLHIAYDALPSTNWEIYIVDVRERIPKKLVTNLSSATRPHWSKDGRWIYFRSYDPGKAGIYRCPAWGGDATRLSEDPEAFSPVEARDGSTVYFASHQWNSTLKKTSTNDGTESTVDGIPPLRSATAWALVPERIYFVPAKEPNSLFYFDTRTRKVRKLLSRKRDFGQGLSISPDRTWIAFSDRGTTASDIMYVRSLH